MKKNSPNAIIISIALLIQLLSAQIFASTAVLNKTMKVGSTAGCMGCHQSQAVQTERMKKTLDDLRLANREKTAVNQSRKQS